MKIPEGRPLPKFTGNPYFDLASKPKPETLPVWFHIIMGIGTLLTAGVLLPIWIGIAVVHYLLVYRQSADRIERWEEAYQKFYRARLEADAAEHILRPHNFPSEG